MPNNDILVYIMVEGLMMLHIALLASFVVFFTVMSIIGVKQTRHLLKTDIDEKARVQTYITTTFGLWIPVLALFTVVAFSDISFADIGFTLPTFQLNPIITAIILASAILWSAYFLYMIIAFMTSEKHRQHRNDVIAKKSAGSDYYDLVIYKLMVPRTKLEKRWWFPLSISAGVCEEIIFRGAFVFLVANIFPDLSIYIVFIIVVVLFGLGHFYQGTKGFILSTLVGAFFTLIYIASGSLIFVIAIHFLTDFANAFEYSGKVDRTQE